MKAVTSLLVCAVALCALTPAASASSLGVSRAGVLHLSALPGEVNAVTLREVAIDRGSAYLIDDGAGLSAGRGCTQVSPTQGQCVIGGASDPALGGLDISNVVLDLGNRADTSAVLTFTGFTGVAVQGDGGDDRISGGAVVSSGSAYTVDGGPGDDTIDAISTNGSPVNVDGGPGDDTLATAGTVGTGRLRGGVGADHFTLRGNVFATVDAGPGADVLTGDAFIGPTVFGGVGNDTLDLPRAASLNCGPGRDTTVFYAGQATTACEPAPVSLTATPQPSGDRRPG